MKKSVVIAGVGGQGIITAANILARTALKEGHNVITSELHGMAQRGGNVECSVRIGDVFSPIIPNETAEALISFEPLEALRNIDKIKKNGIVVSDTNPVVPPLISLGIGTYPSLNEIFEEISSHCTLIKIDADTLARTAGNIITKNIVMLGAFHAIDTFSIKEDNIRDIIKDTISSKYIEMNMKAFEMGKKAIGRK
jgi:indolepyruvate ferredoxin oxidoreductase beta subunit